MAWFPNTELFVAATRFGALATADIIHVFSRLNHFWFAPLPHGEKTTWGLLALQTAQWVIHHPVDCAVAAILTYACWHDSGQLWRHGKDLWSRARETLQKWHRGDAGKDQSEQ